MAMGRLAVALPCHAAEGGEVTFWLGVVAFGKQADALAGHVKGDLVSVAGAMQVNQWTGKDGGTQQGYQVVADSVISARTVRPGGKRAESVKASEPAGAIPRNPRRDGSYITPLMILTSARRLMMKIHSEGDKHGKRQ
jgi:single-stranded DNA-binding protein